MSARLLDLLHGGADLGWWDRMAWAQASWVHRHDPQAGEPVLWAVALVAHAQSRGDVCWDLRQAMRGLDALDTDTAELALSPGRSRRSAEQVAGLREEWQRQRQAWWPAEVWAQHLQDWCQKQKEAPYALDGHRFYLRRAWTQERRVAQRLLDMARSRPPQVDVARRQEALRACFPQGTAGDWQAAACSLAISRSVVVVTGGPGTGKTYTAARMLSVLWRLSGNPEQCRMGLAAPTGKAAARLMSSLRQAIEASSADSDAAGLLQAIGHARTLHKWLGARHDTRRFIHHAAKPLPLDVLLVDEASMIHLEMMDALLDALAPHTTLILLGDREQLASVEAGSVLGDVCAEAVRGNYWPETMALLEADLGAAPADPDLVVNPQGSPLAQCTVMLRKSRRFSGDIGLAARSVQSGRWPEHGFLTSGDAQSTVRVVDDLDLQTAQDLAWEAWQGFAEQLAQKPPDPGEDAEQPSAPWLAWMAQQLEALDAQRVLCAVRLGDWGVQGMNEAIVDRWRRSPYGRGVGDVHGWWSGRPVLVARNSPELGVFNGDVGLAWRVRADAPLKVWFPDTNAPKGVLAGRLQKVETALAMTVHKSQGSEFAHTLLVLPPRDNPGLTREWLYTGLTRARSQLTVLASDPTLLGLAAARPTQRVSGLGERLRAVDGESGDQMPTVRL